MAIVTVTITRMQRHKETILSIFDERQPKRILEIGVLMGANTIAILRWCASNNAHLISLDPVNWEGDIPESIKAPAEGYLYKRGQEHEKYSIRPEHNISKKSIRKDLIDTGRVSRCAASIILRHTFSMRWMLFL
jgi:hypothetical protein